jgi:hypothetical protein
MNIDLNTAANDGAPEDEVPTTPTETVAVNEAAPAGPVDLGAPPVLDDMKSPEQREMEERQAQEAATRQAEAEQRAVFEQRKAASLLKDSMGFLTTSQVTDLGDGYYRSGNRLLVSDSASPMMTNFIQRVAVLHVGGQKAFQYLETKTIFKLGDYQKAFNGVPLDDETNQDLLIRTVAAITQAAYNSVDAYIGDLFPTVGLQLASDLEALRIPAEKDGGKFIGLEALYAPIGARFRIELLIGVILKYEGDNNHYAIAFTDFSADPQSDDAIDIRVFTDAVMTVRNRYIDQYIIGTLPALLADVVNHVGESILIPAPAPVIGSTTEHGDATDFGTGPAAE